MKKIIVIDPSCKDRHISIGGHIIGFIENNIQARGESGNDFRAKFLPWKTTAVFPTIGQCKIWMETEVKDWMVGIGTDITETFDHCREALEMAEQESSGTAKPFLKKVLNEIGEVEGVIKPAPLHTDPHREPRLSGSQYKMQPRG